ncbi:hypothetical protein [Vibrio crassostreae]|uniref:hypothetical protein n=1 Tax=Vibrio crassostreae TaxID=246167 RepID=UPI001B306F7E|nr:hypothetical protein [Vibrio crassostreae]
MKKILLSTLFVPIVALSFNDDIPDQETANWFGDTGDYSVLATCLSYSEGKSLEMFEAMSKRLAEADKFYRINKDILLSRNILKYGDETSDDHNKEAKIRAEKMCNEIGLEIHNKEWQIDLAEYITTATNALLALYYKADRGRLKEIDEFITHRAESGRNASKWGHDVCYEHEREGVNAKKACIHELVLNYDRSLAWQFGERR